MKYRESLSFNHPMIWMIMLPIVGLFSYGAVRQLVFDKPFGNNPAPDHWLLVFTSIPLLILVLLASARLKFSINEEGIRYRFFPFHFRWHHMPWEEIESVYVRKYNAIPEYGGWGLRINLRGNKAYNVMGDRGMGMEVRRKNGKKILFSTRKPEQLRQFLDALSSKGKPV